MVFNIVSEGTGDAVRRLAEALNALGFETRVSEKRAPEPPEAKDPILSACKRYCDAHTCDTCGVYDIIARDGDQEICIIEEICESMQPVERIIAEVMRFDKALSRSVAR